MHLHRHKLTLYFIIGALFEMSNAGLAYTNSTFLGSLGLNNISLSLFFITESVLSLFAIFSQFFFTRDQLKHFFPYVLLAQSVLLAIVSLNMKEFSIIALLCFLSSMYFTWIVLDIFVEEETVNNDTGATRGIYFTILNAVWIFFPFASSYLLSQYHSFTGIFLLYAFLILIAYFIYRKFFTSHITHKILTEKHTLFSIRKSFIEFKKDTSLIIVTFLSVFLQAFYVIFTLFLFPVLQNEAHFSILQISYIVPFMLLPFVLFQEFFGWLSDKFLGEREILFFGLLLMTASLFFVPHFSSMGILAIMGILFISRIGASAYEIMLESYFFKKVAAENIVIHTGIFRAARPLGYLLTSLVVFFTLQSSPLQNTSSLFPIIGIVLCIAFIPLMFMRDTK